MDEPEIPVRITDNGGRTFDRYAVTFDHPDMDGGALLVGPTGNVANGVCMWSDVPGHDPDDRDVLWQDLPEPVQAAIHNEVALQRCIQASQPG